MAGATVSDKWNKVLTMDSVKKRIADRNQSNQNVRTCRKLILESKKEKVDVKKEQKGKKAKSSASSSRVEPVHS